MRLLLSILMCLVLAPAQAGQFAGLAAGVLALHNRQPDPVPPPPPVPADKKVCENCNGTGKLGDGVIVFNCPECDGTGYVTTTPQSADAQPTPWPGVGSMLNALAPKPNEVLLDPGCGYDARLLIAACQYYNVEKAIGVEIDPEIAESARRHVEQAGLSDRIEIITGDSTKLDIQADIGIAYMWPEFLTAFRPRIEKLNRFVSYGFAVPGLSMATKATAGGGVVYIWQRPQAVTQVPIIRTVNQTVRLPRGSYCEVCGGRCSNPMAHQQYQQVVGYELRPANQSAGRWVTKKVCVNGHCSMQKVWQAY